MYLNKKNKKRLDKSFSDNSKEKIFNKKKIYLYKKYKNNK